ncbi:MAG TPA: alpha/beta fold hydrolase [Gaiellaceae bacterium]|jgi:surfactin synthase thioesterase subunit|nr:alpha/beta fold hydrolase [Gaiellaceae bacterium]
MSREPKWLVRWPRSDDPAVRLICFGHAGAGASAYRAWSEVAPPAIEVCAVRLPGRESRLREPAFDDVHELVPAALPWLAEGLEPPFALFGHCSGALVAFELARELRRRAGPQPLVLIAADQVAPSLQASVGRDRGLDVRERVTRLGGTSDTILENDTLFAKLVPTLVADFRLADEYEYRPEPPLESPIVVVPAAGEGSDDNPGIHEWARETEAGLEVRRLAADHFFRDEAWLDLARTVVGEIERHVGAIA